MGAEYRQEFTDRKLCKKCVHSFFVDPNNFKWCNYLDDTGKSRPHKGCECYGFEQSDGKKKRRRKSIPVNENGRLNKRRKVTVDVPHDIPITAPVKKTIDPDKEVYAAARKILRKRKPVRERNRMLDEMTMWAQHMGDNVNRIV